MTVLRRLNSSRFSEVLPLWADNTVAILGGGPSLTPELAEQIRRQHYRGKLRCIAVNDSYLLAPWADIQYAADARWHEWHSKGVDRPVIGLTAAEVCQRWAEFKGDKCSIEHSDGHVVKYPDVHVLRNRDYPNHGWGLSVDPKAIVTGRNSGFQALNIATLTGAKRILLFGFDGRPGQDRAHWFGEHPQATPASAYAMYVEAMSLAEKDLGRLGVEVINCSPSSAIESFKKMDFEEITL